MAERRPGAVAAASRRLLLRARGAKRTAAQDADARHVGWCEEPCRLRAAAPLSGKRDEGAAAHARVGVVASVRAGEGAGSYALACGRSRAYARRRWTCQGAGGRGAHFREQALVQEDGEEAARCLHTAHARGVDACPAHSAHEPGSTPGCSKKQTQDLGIDGDTESDEGGGRACEKSRLTPVLTGSPSPGFFMKPPGATFTTIFSPRPTYLRGVQRFHSLTPSQPNGEQLYHARMPRADATGPPPTHQSTGGACVRMCLGKRCVRVA